MAAIKKDMDDIEGGASEFAIHALVFRDFLKEDVLRFHRELDDYKSGGRDIYDATVVREDAFTNRGASAALLSKMLSSHERAVDRMKMDEKDLYGRESLLGPERTVDLGSVLELQQALGREHD